MVTSRDKRRQSQVIRACEEDGYDLFTAQKLGFAASQIIEDATELDKLLNTETTDHEELMVGLHALFNNHELLAEAQALLMRSGEPE